MTKRISAVEARHRLGQLMNEVELRGDHYIIERAGKPLVAVIPVAEFEAWRRLSGSLAVDSADSKYPLRGTPIQYAEPLEGLGDWESAR